MATRIDQVPVIFLAFANEQEKQAAYLRNLPEEARCLRALVEQAAEQGQCELVWRTNATLPEILDVFQNYRYRDRIAVFHFGGHANSLQLLLESADGVSIPANVKGLAAFLAQQKDLQLVFLNGCSTEGQVGALLEAGISAVIATDRAIDDAVARHFAERFYRGLVGGADLDSAFNEAQASIWTRPGWDNPRGLYYGQPEEVEGWPWKLYLRPGTEGTWKLFMRPVPPPHRRDFYRHVPLPPNYIPRPELLTEVKQALIDTPQTLALTSAIPMNALHGMGGIGKSVLARALCDDPDIQAAFSDGILWATLGQQNSEAELRIKLREWLDCLGGQMAETVPSLTNLKEKLAELLQERACLMIVDDAWSRRETETFQVGGPRCRLLLTTRDAEVARGLGAVLQPVPVMDPEEAITLLEEWGGDPVRQTKRNLKQQIIRRLGYLPLALRLAGYQLHRQDPESWLASFSVQKLKSRRPETTHDNLFDTLALSLAGLTPEEYRLYLSLAIFKEDEAIPQVAITRLWSALTNYTPDETIDLLHDLAARALLQLNISGKVNLEESTDQAHSATFSNPSIRSQASLVTLHDLLHNFISTKLGDTGHQEAHQALLSSYRQTQTGFGWATAPNDGYLYDHLAYHLGCLADYDPQAETELHSLFANHTWLHTRVAQTGYTYDAYITDLMLAWQRSHIDVLHQVTAGDFAAALIGCVQYALIRTSLNAIANNYPPELVAQAVETGVWSSQRAISVLAQIADAERQAHMAIVLLNISQLTPEQQIEVQQRGLTATSMIRDETEQVNVLVKLAPYLADEQLAQALNIVLAIKGEVNKILALTELVFYLSDDLKQHALIPALQAVSTIKDEQHQVHAFTQLLPHLNDDLKRQALIPALQAASTIKDEGHRAEALANLATHLSDDVFAQALQIALTIRDEKLRAQALIGLVPHLSNEYFIQIFQAVLAIKYEGHRVYALTQLMPQLNNDLKQQVLNPALQAALTIKHEGDQAEALAGLASHLSDDLKQLTFTRALQVALTIKDKKDRVRVLVRLVPHFDGDLKEQVLIEALQVALVIEDDRYQAYALTRLVPYLSNTLKQQAFTRALQATQAIKDEKYQAYILDKLVPHLNKEQLIEVLRIVWVIEDKGVRVDALAKLASHKEQLIQALQDTLSIEDKEYLVQVRAKPTFPLSKEQLIQALQNALPIKDEEYLVQALTRFIPYLKSNLKQQVLIQALQITLKIKNEWKQIHALVELVPYLEGEQYIQALQIASAIKDPRIQADALVGLAPHFSNEQLNQALQAVRAIKDARIQADALVRLAPHFSNEQLDQVLQTVQTIKDKKIQTDALAELVPYLERGQRIQALEDIFEVNLDMDSVEYLIFRISRLNDNLKQKAFLAIQIALEVLKPYLGRKIRQRILAGALQTTLEMLSKKDRIEVLTRLVPYLDEDRKQKVLTQALQAALEIWDEKDRIEILMRLVPHLDKDLKQKVLAQALQAVLEIRNKGDQVEVLIGLSSYFDKDLKQEAFARSLQAALTIEDPGHQAEVLIKYLPHIQDQTDLVKTIQKALVEALFTLQNQERSSILHFLAAEGLFAPPMIPVEVVEAIAQQTLEICWEWEWI